ncbi:hypothetical protein HZS92_03970 [Xanthomonas citri pv. citri]|nr:hypothetical protein HZS92_03970 [Xanthomonas citri pv. citri]
MAPLVGQRVGRCGSPCRWQCLDEFALHACEQACRCIAYDNFENAKVRLARPQSRIVSTSPDLPKRAVSIASISRRYRVVATLVLRVLAGLVETVIPMRWRPVP